MNFIPCRIYKTENKIYEVHSHGYETELKHKKKKKKKKS